MKAIVAVDRSWGIGRDNQLLVRLKKDMAHFRKQTLGQVVVMGRKTLESLPGGQPLDQRTNIVMTRDPAYRAVCSVCHSIAELESCIASYTPDSVYVIGGEAIYRQLLPFCDTVYVTKIDAEFPADSFFPNLDADLDWVAAQETEIQQEADLRFRFVTYKRNR